jgi:hypothetical protein
MCTKLLKYLKK